MNKLDKRYPKDDGLSMNPFHWVVQDDQNMPDKPDQALNAVHRTWFESLHIPYANIGQQDVEVCFRIFSDTYYNLFISGDAMLSGGKHTGHALKIPLAFTDHGTYLQAGCNVDVTNLRVSESAIAEFMDHILDNLADDQMTILYNKNLLD